MTTGWPLSSHCEIPLRCDTLTKVAVTHVITVIINIHDDPTEHYWRSLKVSNKIFLDKPFPRHFPDLVNFFEFPSQLSNSRYFLVFHTSGPSEFHTYVKKPFVDLYSIFTAMQHQRMTNNAATWQTNVILTQSAVEQSAGSATLTSNDSSRVI